MKSYPDHERLFDEICGKLNELSMHSQLVEESDMGGLEEWNQRLEKMQSQLKKSQDDILLSQTTLQEKIASLDHISSSQSDLNQELKRLSEQLDLERQNNSKLSTDLAKSLELNLKLQFDSEEIRSKSNQILQEEKKHNSYLAEKNKSLSHELELAQALCQEIRLELSKARDKFQSDQQTWNSERTEIFKKSQEQMGLIEKQQAQIQELLEQNKQKEEELNRLSESLLQFETHSQQQAEMIKNLTAVAEKKIIELKMSLDKKTTESQDYYSHLQQSLTQTSVLKQENAALKEYITKLTLLHSNSQNTKSATNMM